MMARTDDVTSEKSEGDIPYVGYNDFVEKIADNLPFGKQWDKQQKYYEWNRLVLDKANEVIYGVERAILRDG